MGYDIIGVYHWILPIHFNFNTLASCVPTLSMPWPINMNVNAIPWTHEYNLREQKHCQTTLEAMMMNVLPLIVQCELFSRNISVTKINTHYSGKIEPIFLCFN